MSRVLIFFIVFIFGFSNSDLRERDRISISESSTTPQHSVQSPSSINIDHPWRDKSVLREGRWVKISIEESGIHKIPWSTLKQWGFSDPSRIRLYGAGGVILPENPGNIIYDDLPQVPVWHGKSGGADYLFFYAKGVVAWQIDESGKLFTRVRNPYSNRGHYFLSEEGELKNIELQSVPSGVPTHSITEFNDYLLQENDRYNLIQSGRHWFGDKFVGGTNRNYEFPVINPASSPEITFLINAAARSTIASQMRVSVNGQSSNIINFSRVNTDSQEALFADEVTLKLSVPQSSELINLGLRYISSGDQNAEAWLDYIIINYKRRLRPTNNRPLYFRDINSTGTGNILEFTIEQTPSNLKVWDITDPLEIKEVSLKFSGNSAVATAEASILKEYVAFSPDNIFPEPKYEGAVANQNIHEIETPDFLIVSNPAFINQAEELADYHRIHDNMSVAVVSTQAIYNEFSSGNKDATGIRNFIKMLYDRSKNIKYVLLFGNGSYDNRNINPGSTALIPTYQSESSLDPVTSFVTDDYFVLLDAGESVYQGKVDLGIGRFPVATASQADLMVRKNREYNEAEAYGNWRNKLCFIADDKDRNMHMEDSEKLSNIIKNNFSDFLTEKIYFDAYTQITGPGGESYPEVTDAINRAVDEGVLIINYVGHANTRFLAKENVLDISHINSWSNRYRLPIFVTATCEFSRFDADATSAGEYILLNPNGGGIGLFSTTRLVFAYSNFLLSQNFYNNVFRKDSNGNPYRLGDIMKHAKTATANTINKRNFTLLANPALKISVPHYNVITTSINEKDATLKPDTLGALQYVTVTGYVADESDQKLTNFNGSIVSTVLEKEQTVRTRGNGGETPMQFKVQENIIYQGTSEVKNGEFSFSFVVPKDISYAVGNGKILYYADNGADDASGAFENFLIGGDASQIVDNEGPMIELHLDSENFVPGDRVSRNPMLIAKLSDENGINTVGSGIGHDISATLSFDPTNIIILNNHFQAEINNHTTGTIKYQLRNLPEGRHKLKLKAWDTANNSSEKEIEFEVSTEFTISSVICYPNPASNHTSISFEHNQSGATLEVLIEILDIDGRKIDQILTSIGSSGKRSNPIRWELPTGRSAIRDGLFFVRVTAKDDVGNITTKTGKMVISR